MRLPGPPPVAVFGLIRIRISSIPVHQQGSDGRLCIPHQPFHSHRYIAPPVLGVPEYGRFETAALCLSTLN